MVVLDTEAAAIGLFNEIKIYRPDALPFLPRELPWSTSRRRPRSAGASGWGSCPGWCWACPPSLLPVPER